MGKASRLKHQKLQESHVSEKTSALWQKLGQFLTYPAVILIVLPLVAFSIYSNTFYVPFHLDDTINIVENPKIRYLWDSLDLFGGRYIGYFSFALNYHFGGLSPFGYHLINLLIHITNGLLVYSLIRLLLRTTHNKQPLPPSPLESEGTEKWIALAAALIFVVHPVQTQAVTYIVQRFASLATLFYLLAVICYLKWRLPPEGKSHHLWYGVALLSTILAMKTKQNSFTLPLMILLVEAVFFRAPARKRWLFVVPFLLLLPIIPLSHMDTPGDTETGFARQAAEIGRLSYLFTQFRVIATYIRLLIWPANQTLDYEYPIYHSLTNPPVLISFLFLLVLLCLAFFLLRRSATLRIIAFGIFWFFLTLSSESSIIPIRDVIFEHRVYLPSVGFFLVVSLSAVLVQARWKKMKIPVVLVAFLVIGGFSIATFQRNRIWQNPATLWEDVVRKAPNKARGHLNLGVAYDMQGRFSDAIREYQTALQLNSIYPAVIHDNLGVIYRDQGHLPEAIREFQIALQFDPNYAKPHNNLGVAYKIQGRSLEAIQEYEAAIRINPDFAKAHNNLANIYSDINRIDEAIREYQTALRLDPNNAKIYSNLGVAYGIQGRFTEAIEKFRIALQLQPNLIETRYNLGRAYWNLGMLGEARGEFEQVVKIKPDFTEARRALKNLNEQSSTPVMR